jgi:pimeloyl-ACP methyl ester carboxylesterase
MPNPSDSARRIFTGWVLGALMLACALAACGDRNASRRIELSECRLPKLASAAQCGTLEVPEDRMNPSGRRIPIAFAVLPANTLSAKPDPLFMLAGGPGQSADAVAPLAGMLGGVRRDRDIVLVDPRGTGKSAPLQCAALAPRDLFDELIDTDIAGAAGRCLVELKARANVDVAQYTTPAFVADLDAVRDALGYERINLWVDPTALAWRRSICGAIHGAYAARYSTASRRRICGSASTSGRRAKQRWRKYSPRVPRTLPASARIPTSMRLWPPSGKSWPLDPISA